MDLLDVEWQVESTKMIGEYEVANTYTAKCYYTTKQRVDYPNTYTVTAEYLGNPKKPRYYQRIAINRVIEAIAQGKNRLLLVMATGTGKHLLLFKLYGDYGNQKPKRKFYI